MPTRRTLILNPNIFGKQTGVISGRAQMWVGLQGEQTADKSRRHGQKTRGDRSKAPGNVDHTLWCRNHYGHLWKAGYRPHLYPLYPNPAAEAVGLGPHHYNKYYTQQQGWMKSEDDEKKPVTREICFSRVHLLLLKFLCYPSLLQPSFFLTLNKGPISFLFSPCLTAVLLGVPSWSRWEDVHGSQLPIRVCIWPGNFRANNYFYLCGLF